MPTHPYVSRFFVKSDPRCGQMIYSLPEAWWSRPYEYEWCTRFVSPHDVVLDAACGISHPLKYYLAQHSAEAYACDRDPRILSREAILENVAEDIGEEAARLVEATPTFRLHLAQADLIKLPYEDESFDTIFCISVLEHLSVQETVLAVREFHRTLNGEGLLILTFDHPTVNLPQMNEILLQAGFRYWGETDFNLPADAVHTEQWGGLNCFRAVLKKVEV